MALEDLQQLPAHHAELVKYIAQHPDKSMIDILEPYRKYEAQLRSVFAQDRRNPILNDPYVNVVPLFTDNTRLITTRARDLASESEEEKSKYIMALPDDKRRPHGSPATVASLGEFQKNFSIFSESSLAELNWDNVVAAGSSVVNTLLPVPQEFTVSKRTLRQYYHDKFCPASDVDLFLYGLTHDEAIEKIKQIEQAIRDSILSEVTVVRTKYAITIASQYPVRHVQIVLRVYKSISEILTGFDIDAAGGAYDGKQVYVTPRALGSFITQINHIDLTRRSPSYENRLSKYSHRNFEVYWPDLDRSRIDPTIFERSFQRTLGLARLLVLERLPTTQAREAYMNKRRQERGRPEVYRNSFKFRGNIKGYHEDEIADWLSEEDVSNYHTFTVPYGERFNAKRIEKLCYTRDLLLNAEWNQPKDRQVYLHRHPAFFGRVEDVIEDCCGSCPKPATPEEVQVAEKEAEVYISRKVSFLIDDPGRQQIGSFNPLTEQDWTDMAYVGNTARLCQSIASNDVDDVLNWLSQEGADPNQRDYTGRSPLHLAVMVSSPEIVRCLVDHDSRLTARLADGKTALHLAAARGSAEIIKILMQKSIENEEAEEERQARRRQAGKIGDAKDRDEKAAQQDSEGLDESGEDSDGELVDGEDADTDGHSIATGSFVNVKKATDNADDAPELDGSEDEPDYYQIDILAWDVPCSPLHLAIAGGHEDAVKLLCDYGADSILPVKLINNLNDEAMAILTLSLTLSLPLEKAKSMALLLLKLGASSSQADSDGCTAFHWFVASGKTEMIDTLLDNDKIGVKSAINHLFQGNRWNFDIFAPLHTALEKGDPTLVLKMLNSGALTQIDFDTWSKAVKAAPLRVQCVGTLEQNQHRYNQSLEQPLLAALRSGDAKTALMLLENGADPNTMTSESQVAVTNQYRRSYINPQTVLDIVQQSIQDLRAYTGEKAAVKEPVRRPGIDTYLLKFEPGTYQYWIVSHDIRQHESQYKTQMESYEKELGRIATARGAVEKRKAIEEIVSDLGDLERALIAKGGMKFADLHPDMKYEGRPRHRSNFDDGSAMEYKCDFSYYGDEGMTEARRDGYVKLMEAAWAGDVETIKSLTLQAWGPDQEQPPLKMATTDVWRNSPFSVAFLRGHYEVAWAVLEIIKAQWSPAEKDEVRYKLQSRDEDEEAEDSCGENEEDADSELRIVSEKVENKFTIDDIGQVSMQVKSHVKPLAALCSGAPGIITDQDGEAIERSHTRSFFVHAMDKDDASELKMLLEMAQKHAGETFPGDDDESGGTFTFPQDDFLSAVENGKTQSLRLVIKRTGAGIPLDHLVKKSGVEMKQKPRYYQGLTVYGKKRKDWATAGRNMVVRTTGLKTPPLLHAAIEGHVEGVEFFLSDAPHRLYGEFCKSKAGSEDLKLKHLKDSPGGFDRVISRWLGADNEFVLHCAVLATPSEHSMELVKYVIENCPESMEKRTSEGDTPLMIACRLGRPQYFKLLVEANADQSTRNHKGENILHAAVAGNPKAAQLRSLVDLVDPDLRRHLFVHRKKFQENATTPLHTWISQACRVPLEEETRGRYRYAVAWKPYKNEKDVVEMVKLLLEYSAGEELDMLNGAGDTCLHTAVMYNMISIVKALVDFRPQLLYRENAVGRTPAEVAYDRFTAAQFARPAAITRFRGMRLETYAESAPSNFIDDASVEGLSAEQLREKVLGLGLSDDYQRVEVARILALMGMSETSTQTSSAEQGLSDTALKRVIWDLCQTTMQKNPGKRRLVSLNEANDVARRLGEKHTGSRYFTIQARGEDDDEDDKDEDKARKDDGDFVLGELRSRIDGAWTVPGHVVDGKCTTCGIYH